MSQLIRVAAEHFSQYRAGFHALLSDAIASGASLGFLANFSQREADEYFEQVQDGLNSASHCLWLVLEQGQVVASIQLVLCLKANGLNRAEIQKLMVLRSARRQGLAAQLMAAVEAHAHSIKRGLLYLDTEAGSAAELFYQQQGYQCIGGLPDYACGPDGQYRANAIYYKTLSRAKP
ncbi:GNAT family N-acetyltransferase [Pseudomonas sp. 5P_3.1_Bac2]|uniref:GNAT family N-acetyltransferase n=1 Tax=Pseudomonas sp. 5P_3.1_Bac2 TaxID=2971617 RepID=UPI003965D632